MGLEHELAAIKAVPVEPLWQNLEEAVWHGIEHARAARIYAPVILTLRAVVVVCAAFVGIVGGSLGNGAVTREQDEISVFSVDSQLAPSTLLDSRG